MLADVKRSKVISHLDDCQKMVKTSRLVPEERIRIESRKVQNSYVFKTNDVINYIYRDNRVNIENVDVIKDLGVIIDSK